MGGKVGKAIGGYFGMKKAQDELDAINREVDTARLKMETAIQGRQDIINPYAGITDLSGLARDLSSQVTNPYNNLQVSTAAAEMQAEETDQALANSLETMKELGAGAGGATALAMAALKSKKDVSADIQQQEAKNAELKAKGEEAAEGRRIKAMQEYDQATIQLKGRKEQADAQGEIFQFQAREKRTNDYINRYTSMYLGLSQAANEIRTEAANASGDFFGALGDIF